VRRCAGNNAHDFEAVCSPEMFAPAVKGVHPRMRMAASCQKLAGRQAHWMEHGVQVGTKVRRLIVYRGDLPVGHAALHFPIEGE
jgi:hypothetical protein